MNIGDITSLKASLLYGRHCFWILKWV